MKWTRNRSDNKILPTYLYVTKLYIVSFVKMSQVKQTTLFSFIQSSNTKVTVNLTPQTSEKQQKQQETTVETSSTNEPLFTQNIIEEPREKQPPTRTNSDVHFEHVRRDGRHYIYCKVCFEFPNIVKRFSNTSKPPAITLKGGTLFRNKVVDEHICTEYHNQCIKASRIRKLESPLTETPLDRSIAKANEKLGNKIGKYMISIYNDAKRLTLSAWSWPSRVVSEELGSRFNFTESHISDRSKRLDLQYLTPSAHLELLECIVAAHTTDVQKKLSNSLAISLRADGSVDRTQVDKIYVLAKIVTDTGAQETVFLGMAEQEERGAKGLYNAIKRGITDTVGNYESILLKTSSIVTDGASINTGEKSGLWRLMEEDAKVAGSDIPLVKIWCAAHRSQLAWLSVSKTVTEIDHLFQYLVGMSSFMHQSGIRTRELKNVAETNHLKLLHLPKMFEVRWSEFTFDLLNSVLTSWRALVMYFDSTTEPSGKGYFKYLTDISNLRLICAIADVLQIFMRFQKKMQSDTLTVISMSEHVKVVTKALQDLRNSKLLGGWEETLTDSLQETTGIDGETDFSLNGVKLTTGTGGNTKKGNGKRHNLYVTTRRDINAVRNEVIESLCEFLQQRFDIDNGLISILKPFVSLDTKADVKSVQSSIARDVSLVELSMQYQELCDQPTLKTLTIAQLVSHLASENVKDNYGEVLIVLARILSATPHSADVERSISANNLLKTSLRSSLNLSTENKYLFIHFNMPDTITWNPRTAVMKWFGRDRRVSNRSSESCLTRKQEYFKGLFPEAARAKIGNEEQEELPRKRPSSPTQGVVGARGKRNRF